MNRFLGSSGVRRGQAAALTNKPIAGKKKKNHFRQRWGTKFLDLNWGSNLLVACTQVTVRDQQVGLLFSRQLKIYPYKQGSYFLLLIKTPGFCSKKYIYKQILKIFWICMREKKPGNVKQDSSNRKRMTISKSGFRLTPVPMWSVNFIVSYAISSQLDNTTRQNERGCILGAFFSTVTEDDLRWVTFATYIT